jgi:alkyl hydroperoxide reductase subunit AhpC
MARLKHEFDRRGAKVIGLSVDPVDNHARWSKDIEETQGIAPNYPMIADTDLKVSKHAACRSRGDMRGAHPRRQPTVRNVFIIGPDKLIRLILVYPMTTGRNFHEVLRVLDSMQLTARHKVATPADWKPGEDVIITPAVSDEEARQKFPGFKTLKPYLQTTQQPA